MNAFERTRTSAQPLHHPLCWRSPSASEEDLAPGRGPRIAPFERRIGNRTAIGKVGQPDIGAVPLRVARDPTI